MRVRRSWPLSRDLERRTQGVYWIDLQEKICDHSEIYVIRGGRAKAGGHLTEWISVRVKAGRPVPTLAFEHATKKNKPYQYRRHHTLQSCWWRAGHGGRARVWIATAKRQAGLGSPYRRRFYVSSTCSISSRKLLNLECTLLTSLGKVLQFEIAVGRTKWGLDPR